MQATSRVLFSCLLLLSAVPALVWLPLGAGQNFTTITSVATVTSQLTVTSASTSIVGVGQQTTIQTTSANVTGVLPATNGTVGCVYGYHPLTGGTRGQNISLTSNSLNPIDIYFLSEANLQSWLKTGPNCNQIKNALLTKLSASGSFSFTVTLPADGNYAILVLNRASNAQASYAITISFGKSEVVNVTTYATIVESSVQSTLVTERLVQTEEIQGRFSGQNILLIAVAIAIVVLVVVAIAYKAHSGKRPAQKQTARSQIVGGKFCVNCGTEFRPNVTFCGKCGKPVSS